MGYHSQIVLSGRQINDQMGDFIGDKFIKLMVKAGKKVIGSKVAILGLTFKEHTPDTRNSKVADIIRYLEAFGVEINVVDPWADPADAYKEYQVELVDLKDLNDVDALIMAVGHQEFKQLSNQDIEGLFKADLPHDQRVIIDVKSILDADYFKEQAYTFWRL